MTSVKVAAASVCLAFALVAQAAWAQAPAVHRRLSLSDVPPGWSALSSSLGALDTRYANTPASMANVVVFGVGNRVSYCPFASCLSPQNGGAPTNDHQRTSALFSSTTQVDNKAEEQTLAIETEVVTGAKTAWVRDGVYAAGANVVSGTEAYRASAPCIAGPNAPQGRRDSSDGGCRWVWISDSSITAKLGLYMETAANGGAGFTEGLVTNFQMQDARYSITGIGFDTNQGANGVEHDFANNVADCGIGKCVGMSLAMVGAFRSWVGLSLDGGGGSHGGAQGSTAIGMRIGNRFATDVDLSIVDASKIGILIGDDSANGGNSGSTTHAVADIATNSTSPTAFSIGGTHTIASIVDGSTSPNGIALNGRYSKAQIVGPGWSVSKTGALVATSVTLSQTAVADLPACGAAAKGTLIGVVDAKAPAYNAPLVGGGTAAVPAYCNGLAWTAH